MSGGEGWLVSGCVCVPGAQFVPVPVVSRVQFGSLVVSGVAVPGVEVVSPLFGLVAELSGAGASARRIVPLLPLSSPECMQPVSPMPAAAASAIQ